MAAGTGGHIFPALAVAQLLRTRGWRVEWLGTAVGIEATVVPANDFSLHRISAVGLRGKDFKKLLLAPWFLACSFWQTVKIFRQIRPRVVLGMGGFVTGSGGMCARIFGAPLVIHEQNAIAGTANRVLACFAQRVLSAFPNVFAHGEVVGNPVRADIARLAKEPKKISDQNTAIKLLVLGGSQGAQILNDVLPHAIGLLPDTIRPEVFHQSGKGKKEGTRERYGQLGVDARVDDFVDDMAAMYQWADIVVCRAGAMTVSELACAQLPAVLIPLPSAIDDHQNFNARYLVDAGASYLLPQSQLNAETLADMLKKIMANRAALQAMADTLRSLASITAAERVADICEELADVQ